MKYKIYNDRIEIQDCADFCAKHICECGQMFRYFLQDDKSYVVLSKNHVAKIVEGEDRAIIYTPNVDYFVKYFDLDTDYSKIKQRLNTVEKLVEPIKKGYGIRIINGDKFEVIIEFIISANNNIKRIQKIVEKICQIGEDIVADFGTYKAFPTMEQLANQTDEWYASLGAGYRAPYIKQTAKVLSKTSIAEIEKMDSNDLYKWLLSLKGVGPKVASCIMLFGFGRREFFPVDTWVEKIYNNHFYVGKKTRKQIQKYFENLFKEDSGIAQQYLFFAEREK